MKNYTLVIRTLLILAFSSLLLVTSCQNNDLIEVKELSPLSNYTMEPIKGQYVVVLKENMTGKYATQKYSERIASLKKDYLARFSTIKLSSDKIKQTYGFGISGFAAQLDDEQLLALRQDDRIKSIEQDYMITLNPDVTISKGKPNGGGGTTAPAQEKPWGIERVGGGINVVGLGKTAWIIDTGIDLTHPDLNVDTGRSLSFLSGRDALTANDGNGHGTHVAGTIAAIDNNRDVIGVAAGATVVAVRVLDSRGSGSYSGVIAGVEYVGKEGQGDVANMSLGGPFNSALNDVVLAASNNVKFAIAAGNSSDDADNYSPASANGPNIYTVSAMDNSDKFAYFSNYGSSVDFCAPGVSIKSLWKGGGTNTISGTSMAAPHVCGLLLLGAINPTKTVIDDPDGNPDPIAHH